VALGLVGGGLAPVLLVALVLAILAAELVSELLAPAPAESHRAPSFGSEAA
jgi:hypothetical protein